MKTRKTLQFIIIFFIITAWVFSGFPVIWQNPRIPPKIQEVEGASPETFNASGTFTASTGIYAVDAECRGGGGAGAGNTSNTVYGEGGGGGGAYAKGTNIAVTPGTGYTVSVGGAGTAAQGAGGGGGDSYFKDVSTVLAKGGSGGSTDTGGNGGASASSAGDADKKFSGGKGGNGGGATYGSGGGGGGAGNAAVGGAGGNGGNGPVAGTAGAGGTSGGGAGAIGKQAEANGGAGTAPGGGGSGAYLPDATNHSGGAGSVGKCVVYYTDTWAPSTALATYSNTWSFATAPNNASTSQIDIVATTGYDYTTINYLFTLDNTDCGSDAGTGGTTSSWQASTSYSDTGLQPNQCYGYTAQARDTTPNTGTASSRSKAYTSANTPGTPTLSGATTTTLNLTNDANGNPASNPTTNFAVQVVTTSPNDSTWLNQWVNASGNPSATAVWLTDSQLDALTLQGLAYGTTYGVKVKAKNQDGDETPLSAEGQGTTTSAIISVTITTDKSVDYGTLNFEGIKSTIDLSDTQTAKNDGNIIEDFNIMTSNATGGIGWTLDSSSGINKFVHEFKGGGAWTKFTAASPPDAYQTLVTGIAVNGTLNFDLRLTAPTSSDPIAKTITVTIQAVQSP